LDRGERLNDQWDNGVVHGAARAGKASMFDLILVAKGGRWVLVDDEAGELGAFASRADALRAAGAYEAFPGDDCRYVLIQEETGEWEEAVVEIPRLH
jgi:hypothetical protein